jgi:hypothetical protein
MEVQLPLARRAELAWRHKPSTAPRQLDLILDDVRFRAMTRAKRQAVLRAIARLLLEAGGVATREIRGNQIGELPGWDVEILAAFDRSFGRASESPLPDVTKY